MEKKLVIFERESESKDIILGYLNDCKIRRAKIRKN